MATSASVPIIGNGDILTHYEAARRLAGSGVAAVMAGRGALIKPWLFQEFKEVGGAADRDGMVCGCGDVPKLPQHGPFAPRVG